MPNRAEDDNPEVLEPASPRAMPERPVNSTPRREPSLKAAVGSTGEPKDEPIALRMLHGGVIDAAQLNKMRAHAAVRAIPLHEAAVELGFVSRTLLAKLTGEGSMVPAGSRRNLTLSPEVAKAFEHSEEVSDQFANIRTQVHLGWLQKGAGENRMISVISPRRRDGRSYVAANLAVSFARIGFRTLLIDADLRHGRLHELFALREQTGLTGLLDGPEPIASLSAQGGLGNLVVLGRGASVEDPANILAGGDFERLLQSARRDFDVIIVDTPSALEFPDARIAAALTKACVLVAKRDRTHARELKRLAQDVTDLGSKVIGTVLIK